MKRLTILLICIIATFAYSQTISNTTSQSIFYNSSGPLKNIRCFISGPMTTAADGTWSINISSANIITIRNIQVTVTSPSTTGATSQLVPITNPNVGNVFTGKVMSGTGILLLGASSLIPVTTAATVHLEVCGN